MTSANADSPPQPARYNWLARQLHWIIAAAILLMFFLGFTMTALPLSETRLTMIAWHKWLGITILTLAVARLLWRYLSVRPDDHHPAVPAIMNRAAKLGHLALYALLLIVPLLGWLYSSAAGFKVVLFELVPIPDLVGKNKQLADLLAELHEIFAWTLLVLVIGHVAAVVIHHLRFKDPILTRMRPSALHVIALVAAIWFGTALFVYYRFVNPPVATVTEETANTIEKEKSAAQTTADRTADPSSWQIATETSKLDFTATQKSAPTTGSFTIYRLEKLLFDASKPEDASVTVVVDINSIELGNTLIAQTLLGKDWFNVAEHPTATFSASGFKPLGDNRYQLNGELTINGITKPQPLTLTITEQTDPANGARQLTATGEATISRLAFNIGQGEWSSTETLADEVLLSISVNAIKPQ